MLHVSAQKMQTFRFRLQNESTAYHRDRLARRAGNAAAVLWELAQPPVALQQAQAAPGNYPARSQNRSVLARKIVETI